MAETLGFIGLGNMGTPMAGRLIDAGYELVVHDARPEAIAAFEARGARRAGSPAEVGAAASVVLISLPTPAIVEAVVLGEGGLIEGTAVRTVVDLSTTGPRMAARIGAALDDRGMVWVDSPVSGGAGGAKAGTLAVMVAGPPETCDQLIPVLKVIGKIFRVGERAGMGQTMKLVNNLLSAASMAISAEAVVMGVKAGLDPDTVIDVVNAGSGRSSSTLDKFPRSILPRTFDYGFATGLMYKDVKLCLDEAEAMGLSLWTANTVRQVWFQALNELGADSDFTALIQVAERAAAVEVRGKAAK